MGFGRNAVSEGMKSWSKLTFHIPADAPVKTFSTDELMLIPAEPLFVSPFEEGISTLDAAPWHGTIERSPLLKRVFKNAEGSWSFYYEPDGKSHTFWDCYADITHDSASDGWMVTDGTWIAVYHALLYYLQGRRVLVDVPDGKGNIVTYKGRCWVSSYTTDEDGRIKATIGYSLAPPEDMNL